MLRFGGYLLRFHLASDWSQNNKNVILSSQMLITSLNLAYNFKIVNDGAND